MTDINFARKSIQGVFTEVDNFAVPTYQRGYAWTQDQWEDFWNDLQDVYEGKETDHFLGQIVINELDGRRYVVDGQQRITTIVILLAVLRDHFTALANDDTTAKVRAKDLQDDLIEGQNGYRFHQSEQLDGFFRRLIQMQGGFDLARQNAHTESEKNLVRAYRYLDGKIQEAFKNMPSVQGRLEYLQGQLKALTAHEFVMFISTADEASAFVIFETLNARGRDLNSADLLKNHLFRQAKGDESIKRAWDKMMDALDSDSERATKFIRAYWNATATFTTEKKLYRALSQRIQTAIQAENLVERLADLAEIYATLDNPKQSVGFVDPRVLDQIAILKDLGAKTYYPLILMMDVKGMSEQDILIVLNRITGFTVRNFTIGGLVANQYEKMFATIARNLNDGKIQTVKDITEAISEQMLADERFRQNMATATVKTERAARYLLSELAYDERFPLADVKILKLNANVEEPERIGNKVLLTKVENKNAKQSVARKLATVQDAAFNETRRWADRVDKMTSEEIQQRQEQWADQAVEIWSRDPIADRF